MYDDRQTVQRLLASTVGDAIGISAGLHGTLYESSSGYVKYFGGRYTFTGAQDSYRTTTSSTGQVGGGGGFTLCAWVKRKLAGSQWDRLIDFGSTEGRGPNIIINFNYGMRYDLQKPCRQREILGLLEVDPTGSLNKNFPVDKWTHVSIVHPNNGDAAKIYWNGVSCVQNAFIFPAKGGSNKHVHRQE